MCSEDEDLPGRKVLGVSLFQRLNSGERPEKFDVTNLKFLSKQFK